MKMTKEKENIEIWVNRINNIKQGKLSYVVEDLEEIGVPSFISFFILLTRGIFKWMAVRRKLIKLKNKWKDEISLLYKKIKEIKKGSPEYQKIIGYIKGLERCRKEVRELCHSPRIQAPDNDIKAQKFLEEILRKEDTK